MRITSKGQVTIPIEIREKLGLLPETEVVFEVKEDTVVLRKNQATSHRLRPYLDRMRGRANTRLSTDEIMALTRRIKE